MLKVTDRATGLVEQRGTLVAIDWVGKQSVFKKRDTRLNAERVLQGPGLYICNAVPSGMLQSPLLWTAMWDHVICHGFSSTEGCLEGR